MSGEFCSPVIINVPAEVCAKHSIGFMSLLFAADEIDVEVGFARASDELQIRARVKAFRRSRMRGRRCEAAEEECNE